MVRNKLAMAVLALSVLQADFASALGLGNLSVKSALNQPLNAEIRLLDTGELDASQVKVQLGSPDDFQRAAVERDFFLTNLKFDVTLDGRGSGVVRITTREPVVEPYLNFVIEARWPNGRVLREFAVLLDPPTFSASRATAPVAPAASGAPARPTRTVEPPKVTSEPAAPAPAAADMTLPAADKGGEYRIQVYDTLSKIAARHRPAADVTIEQTMLAIQRANPQVFIRNNINLIKSGYVIRLPSADEARAISAAAAATEVEEQVREWRGGTRGSAPAAAATGPQLDARAPEPTAAEGGYKEQARLSIAAPGGSDRSSAGEGAAASGKNLQALRDQLAASQESLEKGRRDNQELQSRLDDMERQIATLQRLIALKDDQLAALQAKSAESNAEKSGPQATAPVAVPAPEETPAPAATSAEADGATAPTAAAPTAPAPAPQAAPAPTPTPAAPPAPVKPAAPAPKPDLLQQLLANPLYLAGAGTAVLLVLAALIMQRRRRAAEEEAEALSEFALDDHVDFAIEDDAVAEQETTRIDDAATAVVAQSVAEHADEQPIVQPVRSETGDAIAEADIYLAYGRYQQAVDLLTHAIDAEPTRSNLRVKLLEVYLEMRNREAFRQQFVALQGLGDADAVAQVKDLLSSVDGVSDWLVDLPQAPRPAPAEQRPVSELVAGAAGAAGAATAAIAAADVAQQERQPEPTADWSHGNLTAAADTAPELDLDLDDLGLGDELPRDAELKVEGEPAESPLDAELDSLDLKKNSNFEDDLNLEDDLELNLDGELDLGAPLDLDDGLDLGKELELDGRLEIDNEIDLDRRLDRTGGASARDVEADLAEDLDLETHPGLDTEFDLDEPHAGETPVESSATSFGGELAELTAGDEALDSFAEDEATVADSDFDFEIENFEEDRDEVPPAAASFDLDRTSTEVEGGSSPVATPDENLGLDVDLAIDLELDDNAAADAPPAAVEAAEGFDGTEGLEDLEQLSDIEGPADTEVLADALRELDAPAGGAPGDLAAAAPAELADEFDLGNLDAELPDIDRLDLGTKAGVSPAADELPDLADLPPEFDAAAAELDAAEAAAEEADEFDFLADADEIATKLDLARAYIDMGDTDGARDILEEVMQEGTDTQRQEASSLLGRIG